MSVGGSPFRLSVISADPKSVEPRLSGAQRLFNRQLVCRTARESPKTYLMILSPPFPSVRPKTLISMIDSAR